MNHLSEEELILYYYGEDQSADGHLRGCEACRSAYQDLQRVLNTLDLAAVPERPESYEDQVWSQIKPRLERPGARRKWTAAWAIPLAAALLLGAFLVGRGHRTPLETAGVNGGQIRERLLLVALGDHLERSETVLTELAHSTPEGRTAERVAAEDLLEANRLYKQTAQRAGDAAAANMLDDLERVLLEAANSPSSVSETQLDDMLFKVKVFGSRVQERETWKGKS